MLHVGIHAIGLSALNGSGGHDAGEQAILGVILKVAAREGGAVNVHGGSVPAGNIHLIGHLADALAESLGQIGIPGGGDHCGGGETDGGNAGEVVVDGSGAVAVGGLHLADGLDRCGGVAAAGNKGVHLGNGQLVHKGVPLGVIVGNAAHGFQFQTVLDAGGGHFVVGIVEVGGVVVHIVEEARLALGGHLGAGGGGGGLGVVGKAVGAGQVGHFALGVAHLHGGGLSVGAAGVGFVVGNGGIHGVGLAVQHGVCIGVDGNNVIAFFQHIAAGTVGVKGSHVLGLEGEGQRLGRAGFQQAGLVKGHQIGGGLLDAAVGVGRVVVDLYHVLAGHAAGIGDGDVQRNSAVRLGHGVDFLGKGGVAQAIAEGIDNGLVVVKALHAVGIGSLVELVAHVDAFHIIDKARGGGDLGAASPVGGNVGQVVHVGIESVAEVVGPRCGGQICQEGVHGLAGGVDFTGQNLAQGRETGLACTGGPDEGVDVGVVLGPAQLHGVGGVDDHDDLSKFFGDALHHGGFAVGQFQIMLGGIQIIGIGAHAQAAGTEAAALHEGVGQRGVQTGGQVGALAAGAGDDDERGIREAFGLLKYAGGLVLVDGGFGNGPVLTPHAHGGAGGTVLGVELLQFGVDREARVHQALHNADVVVSIRHGAGTGAAVHRVGRGPAEYVQFGVGGDGQGAVIFEQHHAFVGDLRAEFDGLGAALLTDGAGAGGQRDEGGHGAKADQIDSDGQRGQHRHACLGTDHKLLGFGQLFYRKADNEGDDGQRHHNAKESQLTFCAVDGIDDVIHIDG